MKSVTWIGQLCGVAVVGLAGAALSMSARWFSTFRTFERDDAAVVVDRSTNTPNTTNVCGLITQTVTWTLANSPYDVCASGVTVGPTATLGIEPGVTVQFDSGISSKLYVQGALNAIGAPAQPITFTGVVTTAGSWGGISADYTTVTPALVSLSYVTLDYGGNGTSGAQVNADRAVLAITNSLMLNGAGNGIYASTNALYSVAATGFISNAINAIVLNTPKGDLPFSDLSARGNGTDGVRILGPNVSVSGQRRWTAAGIPYVVDSLVGNSLGDALSIDAGSVLSFTSNTGFQIAGQFEALGTAEQPITMTAMTQAPGGWRGLLVYGGNVPASAQLDYVTLDYGGSNGATIEVGNGQLVAHHSTVRYSSNDGVRLDSNATIAIQNSLIYSNAQVVTTSYGMRNLTPASAVLATNDYWGDPAGPKSDVPTCSAGNGDKVTAGVIFKPVLTSTLMSAEFPLSAGPILTLSPRDWFGSTGTPADTNARMYFDITLHDGNGAPLPGYITRLHTTLGLVTDGGVTDANGHALAYLTSGSSGDANVTAALDGLSTCQSVESPVSKVTFTAPLSITELFPNSPAPYLSDDIGVTPLPVAAGVSTTLSAQLNNPLTVPITVNVTFEYVQAGIGLAFGPIKTISGTVIPAGGNVKLYADFVPPFAGHYCVQVEYSITAVGAPALRPQDGGSGRKQRNLNVYQAPTSSPRSKDILDKADKSWKGVSRLSPSQLKIQKQINDGWWEWVKDTASKVSQALGFDPPRQDYQQITLPQWHRFAPAQPVQGISITRTNALNAVSSALSDVEAYGTAAEVAMDRNGGATEANDLQWASEQANALIYYKTQLGQAALTYADALDAFVQVLIDEGETDITITASDEISYQQRLSTTGFTTQEITDALQAGETMTDIEAFRQAIIASDPNALAGNLLTIYTDEAAVSRELGNALLHPQVFQPAFSVTGSAGLLAPTSGNGNTLAQIYNEVTTVQIGNPLGVTSTIDVKTRRIDLPADWMVNVSPAQVTLAPGAQMAVTVTIMTGSLLPQGSMPRVAVEGYAGSQLLGGVTIQLGVPNYVPFDGKAHLYLPAVMH